MHYKFMIFGSGVGEKRFPFHIGSPALKPHPPLLSKLLGPIRRVLGRAKKDSLRARLVSYGWLRNFDGSGGWGLNAGKPKMKRELFFAHTGPKKYEFIGHANEEVVFNKRCVHKHSSTFNKNAFAWGPSSRSYIFPTFFIGLLRRTIQITERFYKTVL